MRRDVSFLRAPQVVLFLLIGTLFVVSLIHSWHAYIPVGRVPKDMSGTTLFLFVSRLAFLVFIVNFLNTERRVIALLFCLLGFTMVVIPSAFYNLVTWTGATDVVTGKRLEEFRISADVSSWGQNTNRLAFMCNIAILLIWMFGRIWKARAIRIGGLVAILALTTLVLATGSRSGFLSLGLVSAILLFQRGLPSWSRFGIVGALVVCAVGVLLLLPPDARERLLNYSADQSARQEGWRSTLVRIETDENALEIFASAPLLGVGPGNFRWVHYERYPYSIAAGRPTHNSFLWAATEGGALVLALYLTLLFVIWRDLRAALRYYSPDHQLWHVGWFLMGYLTIFLFFSMFADFWLEPHLYLMAGLSILLRRFATTVSRHRLPSAGAALARA